MFELCKKGSLDNFLMEHRHPQNLTWNKSKSVRKSQREALNVLGNDVDASIVVMKGIGIKNLWALGIAKGCTFLHSRNPPIVHRDLKCGNVLVSDDLTVKITDFGESRGISGQDKNTMTTVGTPYFMAPEVFSSAEEDKFYTKEVDIYSFGILLLEIFLNGDIPEAFNNAGAMVVMTKVLRGWRPDLSEVQAEDAELADIIHKCLAHEPTDRPSFKELIKFFDLRMMKMNLKTER